jgi:hypothetical protein
VKKVAKPKRQKEKSGEFVSAGTFQQLSRLQIAARHKQLGLAIDHTIVIARWRG